MSQRRGNTAPKEGTSDKGQDKQKKLLEPDSGHFSLIKMMHLADLITELNGFCGFMSILCSMRYCLGPPDSFNNIWAALAFMPFGLFFDFMDGKVARWRHKSSLMGQELDSLADLISFGVSPAVCAFALGLRTPIDTLILSFFVLSGLTRLARFNVTVASLPKDATGKSKYFEGTPIPTTLTIALGMAWCVANGYILEKGVALGGGGKGGILDGGVTVFNGVPGGVVGLGMDGLLDVHPVVTIFAVWGCMMTSRSIKIPKI